MFASNLCLLKLSWNNLNHITPAYFLSKQVPTHCFHRVLRITAPTASPSIIGSMLFRLTTAFTHCGFPIHTR